MAIGDYDLRDELNGLADFLLVSHALVIYGGGYSPIDSSAHANGSDVMDWYTSTGSEIFYGTMLGTSKGKTTEIVYTDDTTSSNEFMDRNFDMKGSFGINGGTITSLKITGGTTSSVIEMTCKFSTTQKWNSDYTTVSNTSSFAVKKGLGFTQLKYTLSDGTYYEVDGKFGAGADDGHSNIGKLADTGTITKVVYFDGTYTHTWTGKAIKLESITSGTTIDQFLSSHLTSTKNADIITGTSLNDSINGGLGNDTLTGAGGNDIFMFDSKLDGTKNVDTITDFTTSVTETIDSIYLSKKIFTAYKTAGHLTGADFATFQSGSDVDTPPDLSSLGASAKDIHFVYDLDTGNLFYDKDGNGSVAAVKFANIVGGFYYEDFQIV